MQRAETESNAHLHEAGNESDGGEHVEGRRPAGDDGAESIEEHGQDEHPTPADGVRDDAPEERADYPA